MCDVEKIEGRKVVNDSFSTLSRTTGNDGEGTAALKMSGLINRQADQVQA